MQGNDDGLTIVDEVESTIRQAAGEQVVVVIRLAIGKEVSVPKAKLAKILHERFPQASIEIKQGDIVDSVVVKDIEVG